jgi:hypothetical protein
MSTKYYAVFFVCAQDPLSGLGVTSPLLVGFVAAATAGDAAVIAGTKFSSIVGDVDYAFATAYVIDFTNLPNTLFTQSLMTGAALLPFNSDITTAPTLFVQVTVALVSNTSPGIAYDSFVFAAAEPEIAEAVSSGIAAYLATFGVPAQALDATLVSARVVAWSDTESVPILVSAVFDISDHTLSLTFSAGMSTTSSVGANLVTVKDNTSHLTWNNSAAATFSDGNPSGSGSFTSGMPAFTGTSSVTISVTAGFQSREGVAFAGVVDFPCTIQA